MKHNNKAVQLQQVYAKKLNNITRDFSICKEAGLLFFVEYLKYLKDTSIIESVAQTNDRTHLSASIVTLMSAIAEFEAYKTCQDKTKKTFHWYSFCELLKLNMEDWLILNDSV